MNNVHRGRIAREKRRNEAQDRNEQYKHLLKTGGPEKLIEVLDRRLGDGVGATKERARLAKQMKS